MFVAFPPLLVISLLGAVSYMCILEGRKGRRFHIFAITVFLILTLINPLVSHKGSTVLVLVNDRPITLESLVYGLNSSVMIAAALYWFHCLTLVMTGDKLIYATSFLSKRLSLVISMSIRFVPLFKKQSAKVKNAQRALGLYNEDSITDDIKADMRVFSMIVTWALENGITTADSMEARGFSLPSRSCYRIKKFDRNDALLLSAFLCMLAVSVYSALSGGLEYRFYPNVRISFHGFKTIIGLAAFTLLSFMPAVISLEVKLRWKHLKSLI